MKYIGILRYVSPMGCPNEAHVYIMRYRLLSSKSYCGTANEHFEMPIANIAYQDTALFSLIRNNSPVANCVNWIMHKLIKICSNCIHKD